MPDNLRSTPQKKPKKNRAGLYGAKTQQAKERSKEKKQKSEAELALTAAFNILQPEELRYLSKRQKNEYQKIFNKLSDTSHLSEKVAIIEKLDRDFPENTYTLMRLCFCYAATKHEKKQVTLNRLTKSLEHNHLDSKTVQSVLTRGL